MAALEVGLLILGIYLLIKGADWLVESSTTIAKHFNISNLIIGLTLVAFGTSFPELAVSIIASLQNYSSISIGNVIGSNVFNICIIIGIIGLSTRYKFKDKKLLDRDASWLLTSCIIFTLLALIGLINLPTALLLLTLYAVYSFTLYKDNNHETKHKKKTKNPFPYKSAGILLISGILLYLGADLAVNNTIFLSRLVGIPEWILASTVVAIGTSLPEAITSIVAVRKKHYSLSLGNIVGSNIFNILVVIGTTASIKSLIIDIHIFALDFMFMLAASIFLTALIIKSDFHKKEAIIAILLYTLYLLSLIFRALP